MWWKKLLYFLLVIVLGIGITMISASICFNTLSKHLLRDSVKEEKFYTVERFFSYTTCKETDHFYKQKQEDGSTIEVYPCLVKQPYYKTTGKDGTYVKYDIIEEAVSFSLFDLPENFKTEGIPGKIQLFLDNSNVINLFFDNTSATTEDINYYINFYSYIPHYYSLTTYITYNDFIAHGGASDASIDSVKVFDGKGDVFYDISFTNKPNFMTEMHNDYYEALQEYRDYILQYGEAISVTTYERKDAKLAAIDKITEDNPNKYLPKPSTTIVLASDAFILTISITLAAYISIAIVLTRLIFQRKK